METKLKIKINDLPELRLKLLSIYEEKSQVLLAKYSILLAKHMMEITKFSSNEVIQFGFQVNELWQKNEARMYDVRQAGFKIHALARVSKDLVTQTVYRVIGHAVSCGHMKEHAMVASDYAIKLINLIFPKDESAVKKEREFQIQLMISIV